MAAMLRSLALLLIAIAFTGQARAFSPEGATAPVTNFGGGHGFSFGITGVDSALDDNGTKERPLHIRAATAGLTWAHDGWSVGVDAGRVQYDIPAILQGSAPLAGVSLSREVTGIAGGVLAAQFRAQRLFGDGGSTDLLAVSLRWSLKF